ncbi:MAG TPA: hypothetical protein VIU61_13660 [Kofleriaceae bacterium]
MTKIALLVACALIASAGRADAQPKPSGDKVDAKALMQSGVKLLEAKDYLGALAVFRDAYARFPSAKILLNIGTTLRLLDRHAEAANAYQRYLDASDASPQKKPEVTKVLAELDKKAGLVEVTVTPDDAEVRLAATGEADWVAASAVKRVRVKPGAIELEARRDQYKPATKTATIAAGASQTIEIALERIPDVVPVAPAIPIDGGVTATAVDARGPRSRIGMLALAHLDIPEGGAALVGLTVDVTSRIQVQGAAILGPVYGGYAGASVAVLPGRFRPIVSAGMPVFVSDGARFALRGAGGLELLLNRHVSLIAELGVEYMLNPEAGIKSTRFIPAVGASGRL